MHDAGITAAIGDLALSLGLGFAIAVTYARAYRGFYYARSFVHTCVVTVPLVAVAVRALAEAASAIETSAIAFALVGLLGLIRLRTVVRDTREFTFVFLALVTGTCIGAGSRLLAILSCAVLLGVLAAMETWNFGTPRAPALRIRLNGKADGFPVYCDQLARSAQRLEATAVRKLTGDVAEFHFEMVAREGIDLAAIAQRVRDLDGVTEVSVSRLQRGRGPGEEEG
ncbi:MAG TPA: DUF4956 domain-containing protein [Roseomonas sp.]|jgi:hypothetical protein